MKIYFVRHGKTEWNLQHRFQGGQGNSELLKESYADCKSLGEYLKGTHFNAIYSSPLKRAFVTAQKIEEAMNSRLPIHVDERLREMNLGKMEGMSYADAEKKYPEQVANFWDHPDLYDPTVIGGESYPHAMARGLDFGRDMIKKYPEDDDKILVVSHGAVLSAIMGALLGYDTAHVRQNGVIYNTSLTILKSKSDGQYFNLECWSDTKPLHHKLPETDGL